MIQWRMGFVGGPLDGLTRDVEAVRHHDGWYPREVFEALGASLPPGSAPGSTVLTAERYRRQKMVRPRYQASHPLPSDPVFGYVYVHETLLSDLPAVETQAFDVTAWGPLPPVSR